MMIPKDKLLHIGMGIGALAMTLLVLEIARYNLGAALASMTSAFGLFYEVQQKYRGEGTVDPYDALATAAPGWIAWALIEAWRAMQ